jgi:uncharacterized protein YciI
MRKYYSLKLIPPRLDFAQTMSGQERAVMQQHLAYWADLMQKGIALVYGPVLDPKGTYGLGIVAVEDEEQVRHITLHDPAAQINKYEYFPMLAIVRESKN